VPVAGDVVSRLRTGFTALPGQVRAHIVTVRVTDTNNTAFSWFVKKKVLLLYAKQNYNDNRINNSVL